MRPWDWFHDPPVDRAVERVGTFAIASGAWAGDAATVRDQVALDLPPGAWEAWAITEGARTEYLLLVRRGAAPRRFRAVGAFVVDSSVGCVLADEAVAAADRVDFADRVDQRLLVPRLPHVRLRVGGAPVIAFSLAGDGRWGVVHGLAEDGTPCLAIVGTTPDDWAEGDEVAVAPRGPRRARPERAAPAAPPVEELDLRWKPKAALPAEAPALRRLMVGFRLLAERERIPRYPALRELLVEGTDLPRGAQRALGWLAAFPGLEVLELTGDRRWGEVLVGSDLLAAPDLRRLTLRHCELPDLPAAVARLARLEALELVEAGRGFTRVPERVAAMRLRRLALNGHALAEAPAWLGELRTLRDLSLSGTFREVPPALFALPLEALTLRGALESLPPLAGLGQLRRLDLANNQLRTLPEDLARVASLEVLDVSGNPLGKLPEGLLQLPRLHVLIVQRTERPERLVGRPLSPYLTTLERAGLPPLTVLS